MTNAAERTAATLATIPVVELPVGTVVEAKPDGTVTVDFGEGAVACLTAGSWSPIPGDPVRCLRTSSGTVVLGLSLPRSGTGVVKTLGTPRVTVTTSAGDKQLPYLTSYTPVVGHLVAIDWPSGGIVLGQVTASPAGDGYTPPPVEAEVFTVDFRANDSGSYGSSWFTNEVYCSASNIGAWFYGVTIRDTIPDTAVIESVSLFVPEFYNQFPSSLATIGLHTMASKVGAPSVSSAVTIAAGTGWKALPASFGDALKLGTALGVGTNHGGYHKFSARSSDADSGLLRITWRV